MSKKLPVDWNAFRAMVVGGLSIREVAKRLGVNPATALRQKVQVALLSWPEKTGRKFALPLTSAQATAVADPYIPTARSESPNQQAAQASASYGA
jgi:transposase-like protein